MIVAFGDSITAGQHATRSYADILGYHNAGVPGDTTELALERFDRDVAALKPGVVVIQFGHNDAHVWETEGDQPRVSLNCFSINLAHLVWRCRKIGAQPFIVGLHRPWGRDEEYVDRCLDYDIATQYVAAYTHAPRINVWDWIWKSYLLPDGLHLNDRGHEVYAERVAWYTQPRSSTKESDLVREALSAHFASSEARTAHP